MADDTIRRRASMTLRRSWGVLLAALIFPAVPMTAAKGGSCGLNSCDPEPIVTPTSGALNAAYFEEIDGYGRATNAPPSPPAYQWQLLTQCQVTDPVVGGGAPGEAVCPDLPNVVQGYYIVEKQRLVPADGSPVDGQAPPPGAAPGGGYGNWTIVFQGCVDVTDLNPAPTPDEVFRYFQSLPLPHLTTQQQP